MHNPTDDDESETNTINVVPLADLSLVLLIILMVLSPMVMSSMIRVQAPQVARVAATREPTKAPDPLLIRIAEEGLFLNNAPIDSDALMAEQIRIRLMEEPGRPVIVSAEETILVGRVVALLDLAKQNGADKVSLLKGSRGDGS